LLGCLRGFIFASWCWISFFPGSCTFYVDSPGRISPFYKYCSRRLYTDVCTFRTGLLTPSIVFFRPSSHITETTTATAPSKTKTSTFDQIKPPLSLYFLAGLVSLSPSFPYFCWVVFVVFILASWCWISFFPGSRTFYVDTTGRNSSFFKYSSRRLYTDVCTFRTGPLIPSIVFFCPSSHITGTTTATASSKTKTLTFDQIKPPSSLYILG
jgi:hypothetical protein